MLSVYEEPNITRWYGLEKARLFQVSVFQMDIIVDMQRDDALENVIKSF